MTGLLPVAVYGLKVPAGDVMIPATVDFPATFRITMAAIDPSATPKHTGNTEKGRPARATLKLVYNPLGPGEASDSDALQALLEGGAGAMGDDDEDEDEEDEESSSGDEELNGGPSDQSKTKKARKEAAAQQLLDALAETNADDESEDDMDVDELPKINGTSKSSSKSKGKAKATVTDDQDAEDDEEDDMSADEMEEIVVCTLDPEKNYQQPIDLTIPEDQEAYFKVSGTHAVFLSGNYVVPAESGPEPGLYDEDEEDYDLEPEEDELDDDEESDELDPIEDPRVTEVMSEDDEEIPKLVSKAEIKKGTNKRPAEDSDEETAKLDDIMAKSLKQEETPKEPEQKLSKKQLKKLKKNNSKAADAPSEEKPTEVKEKTDKKVSFAKDLEQPPTPSAPVTNGVAKSSEKTASKPDASKPGVKIVQGVTIDDRKTGKGPVAKKGDKVGMRYIGKLKDGKVFDANKKGTPFRFKLGEGSVIKGWDIGIAGMSAGGERRIVIPPHLAYGSKKLPDIPSNSQLTFDVKLLEIS